MFIKLGHINLLMFGNFLFISLAIMLNILEAVFLGASGAMASPMA